jgi:hypothetical protein
MSSTAFCSDMAVERVEAAGHEGLMRLRSAP